MSDLDNEIQVTPQDELAALKARADQMGISYHPSIGLEKLRDKVNAAIEGTSAPADESATESNDPAAQAPEAPVASVAPVAAVETEGQRKARRRREAAELVRIRVTCMNPAKAEWEGEIFTAGNAVVGSFSKFVPFNADEGWHVPRIIYSQMAERQCQVFTTVTDSRGNKTRKGKLIREFAIEVLPMLTDKELHDLAQRQAMSKAID